MSGINYNQRAVALAKELIGKVIVYKDKRYMISVTEAYPFDEEKDKNGEEISYVNRSHTGKGYAFLTGKDKIGTCFIYAGMLHIACAGGNSKRWEDEYSCDNILIRGAIRVTGEDVFDADKQMGFNEGQPYKLCHDKLGIPSDHAPFALKTEESALKIVAFRDFKMKDHFDQGKRKNVKSENPYRFYLKKEAIE